MEPCICRKISASINLCSTGAEQCKTVLDKQKQYMYLLSVYFLFNEFYIITFNYSCCWCCYSLIHYPLVLVRGKVWGRKVHHLMFCSLSSQVPSLTSPFSAEILPFFTLKCHHRNASAGGILALEQWNTAPCSVQFSHQQRCLNRVKMSSPTRATA